MFHSNKNKYPWGINNCLHSAMKCRQVEEYHDYELLNFDINYRHDIQSKKDPEPIPVFKGMLEACDHIIPNMEYGQIIEINWVNPFSLSPQWINKTTYDGLFLQYCTEERLKEFSFGIMKDLDREVFWLISMFCRHGEFFSINRVEFVGDDHYLYRWIVSKMGNFITL